MEFGGFNGGVSMDQETLVMEVKNLQRSGEEAKHMWWEFCNQQLGGIRDPSRHEANVLQEFLSAYQAGTLPAPTMTQSGGGGGKGAGGRSGMGGMGGGNAFTWGPGSGGNMGGNAMGGSGNALADFVKTGQRASQAWKTIWANYCTTVGTGTFDPSKYDSNFIVSFIDYLANLSLADPNGPPNPCMGMGGMGMGGDKRPMGGMGGMDGGPPKKKMAMGGMGAVDNSPKGQLVEKVKNAQRSGEEMKQAWWNFCDNNLGGVRDPNRHDVETLQAFVDEAGL